MLLLSIFLIFLSYFEILCDGYIRLPGNTELPNIRLKSGYLKANEEGNWKMFYMLLEARDVSRSFAPLIIWFNGGPGCSSLGAFFEEFGPLYVNYDGKTLFENPHSWYKRANILFLESPIGTGFSYDTKVNNYSKADDMQTAQQNFHSVLDFFQRKHPEYLHNDFFVAAESYGGVYGPMLSALITESIKQKSFPNRNFKGLLIGNGFMNVKLTTNTMVLWSAYHSRTSVDEWNAIKSKCRTPGAKDVDEYDFTKFMTTKNHMDYQGDNKTECGRLIEPLIGENTVQWEGYDFFNFYHDCYFNYSAPGAVDPVRETIRNIPKRGIGALMNKYSTDNKMAYSCWADVALAKYLNSLNVKKALGIDEEWMKTKGTWEVCNNQMYDDYNMTYDDMTPFFERLFFNYTGPSFRVLLYNGDTDTACNYLADQYFSRNMARKFGFKKTLKHQPWYYSDHRVIAGYFERYDGKNSFNSNISIDVLTVKGAGHFVPFDRPGPAYQMFNNFIFAQSPTLANYTNSRF